MKGFWEIQVDDICASSPVWFDGQGKMKGNIILFLILLLRLEVDI